MATTVTQVEVNATIPVELFECDHITGVQTVWVTNMEHTGSTHVYVGQADVSADKAIRILHDHETGEFHLRRHEKLWALAEGTQYVTVTVYDDKPWE